MTAYGHGVYYAIGNPDGRIAIHLDADEAAALAALYGPGDEAHYELLEAVRVAYPRHEVALSTEPVLSIAKPESGGSD